MRKYLYLQGKRFFRFLPGILCVILVLLAGVLTAFSLMVRQNDAGEENQKFQVVLCGSADNSFLKMGISAVQAFDSSRFSLEIVQMEEADAAAALARGDIAAYVVIPEEFIEEALHGRILQLKMVTTAGASGMVSIFKEEVTQVVSALLLEAQKGVFGMIDSFPDYGVTYRQELVDDLCIEYVRFVLTRSNTYRLQELGIADSLGLTESLLCGLGVLFLLLACLPFAPLLIRQDPALGRMLAAKGKRAILQSLCDFGAYTASLLTTLLAAAVLLLLFLRGNGADIPELPELWDMIVRVIPVVLLAAAFSFFLYSLSADLISGVLLQFFGVLAMCFVSGCMYPVFFFPEGIQKLAQWLPTGIARTQLACCITGESAPGTMAVLLLYCFAFLAAGTAIRVRAIRKEQR